MIYFDLPCMHGNDYFRVVNFYMVRGQPKQMYGIEKKIYTLINMIIVFNDLQGANMSRPHQ